MGTSQELELAGRVRGVLVDDLAGIHRMLAAGPDEVVAQYAALAHKNPRWSRVQLVQAMTRPASRGATRRGAAAGGLAFIPGWGTALSLGLVATTSPKLLESSVYAIDTVACSYGFDLRDDALRQAARLCVLYWTMPKKTRPPFHPPPPSTAHDLRAQPPGENETLLMHEDEILMRWGASVASWRLSATAPLGVGAAAGAWASYLPIKKAIAAAEGFFGPER